MQRFFSLVAAIVLTAGFAAAIPTRAKTAPKPKVTLRALVTMLLPHAAKNFTAIRGPKYDSDTYYVAYTVPPMPSGACASCKIYDQYGRGKYVENWYVQERWTSTLTTAKNEAYVRAQLAPLLSGFSLHRTVSYGYPTLIWRNPQNTWIYVDMYRSGFTLRVGRDLPKSVHVLLPPSKSQLADLQSASANVIRLGVPAADDNFATLRSSSSKKNIFGANDYGVTASFGSMFKPCTISNVATGFGFKDFQPKWTMNCHTIAMAGTKADLEEPVRAAIYNALSSGFSAVTDPSALLLDDYRWDNSDSLVSVSLSSFEDAGTVSFEVWVTHFLPKQT